MPEYPDDEPQSDSDHGVFEFDAKITIEDWVDFILFSHRGYYDSRRSRSLIVGAAIFACAFVVGGLSGGMPPHLPHDISPTAVFVIVFSLVLFAVPALGHYVFYDRLLRRRYRRWALREHGSQSLPFHGRLGATGYTATDVHGYVHKDWSAIASLDETDRQFFITDRTGYSFPVPKRDLTVESQEQLRAFALAHMSDARSAPSVIVSSLSQDTITKATVFVRYRQTVQDRAATALLIWATPKGRNRRALTALAVAIVVALGIFVFDGLVWWMRWRAWLENWPLATTVLAFSREEMAGFSSRMPYAIGLGLALWAAWPGLLRQQFMAVAAPQGEMPVELAFGANGVATSMPGTVSHHNWSEIKGVLESSEHFGMLMPLSTILPIPKRSLRASETALLRAMFTEHAGRA